MFARFGGGSTRGRMSLGTEGIDAGDSEAGGFGSGGGTLASRYRKSGAESRSGGASGVTSSQQSGALRQSFMNPGNVTASTGVDPREDYAYQRAKGYESGLADMTNEEITRELGRARDEISVGMAKEGEAAIGRGADPSLFRSRALSEGARNMSNLQARLADVALGRRNEAL